MSNFDDGGPAYPTPRARDWSGMSLLQWYAGQSLSGIRAGKYGSRLTSEQVAQAAFEDAQAMISEERRLREQAQQQQETKETDR